MASLLYDDELVAEKKKLATQYAKKYKFDATTEHTQVTLPFPGFVDDGRQLISLNRRTKPHAVDGVVPVRDRAAESERVSFKYVSACLGRIANQHDVREWAAQRAGSSQYYGIEGNLFSQSVWRRHALAALQARGMISSPTETAANVVRYRSSQLFSRLVEYASQTAGSPYAGLDLQLAEANSYRAVEKEDLTNQVLRAGKRHMPQSDAVEATEGSASTTRVLSRDSGADLAAPADF